MNYSNSNLLTKSEIHQIIDKVPFRTQKNIRFVLKRINGPKTHTDIYKEYLARNHNPIMLKSKELSIIERLLNDKNEELRNKYLKVIHCLFTYKGIRERKKLCLEMNINFLARKKKGHRKKKKIILNRWGDQKGTSHNHFIGFIY